MILRSKRHGAQASLRHEATSQLVLWVESRSVRRIRQRLEIAFIVFQSTPAQSLRQSRRRHCLRGYVPPAPEIPSGRFVRSSLVCGHVPPRGERAIHASMLRIKGSRTPTTHAPLTSNTPRSNMTRTRTAKVKAVPQPTRQDRLDDIAMAKFVLKRLRKQPKRSKNWCEWPGCNKFFSRKPDVERHVRSMHLKLKDHVCRVCGKRFAQKTTRDNHEYTHKGIKPYRCDLATESGGICNKLFSDGSSLTRHRSEQHGVVKFQCPYPNCVDRAGNPKCIKRRSEFRKHLSTQHGLVVDSLNPYAVHDEVDGLPVQAAAGPSKARPARSSRQTRRRPARAPSIDDDESVFTPPPPMYSETLNAGEVNLILVPDDDGCTSTPGLSFTSPSPCPSASDVRYENATPPPAYSNFQGCDANNYGFLPNKDMDMSAYPVDGAFGTEETWTDAELFNTLLQVQDFGALSYGNMPIPYPCGLPVPESYGFNDATYEAFTQMPIPDTSYSQFFSAPEQTGYEQFGQYPVWDMPAPELSYNDELPNMIVPPSLLQFSPTDPFAYVPQ